MKRTNAKILSLLLKKFTKEIESLSDVELEELADSPDPLIRRTRPRVQGDKVSLKDEKFDASAVIRALKDMKVREEGATYLANVAPTKGQLTIIARGLDLPVNKRNSQEEIAAKIIEATIGYRIRSAAIRGGHDDVKQERPSEPVESREEAEEKQGEATGKSDDSNLTSEGPQADT